MLPYTICFIKSENKLLLLNRVKSPNMGMWNGIGGKLEKDETPLDGIKREILEETGIKLLDVIYAGNVTWISKNGNSGMYVFLANLPESFSLQTPKKVEEGILEWKNIDWLLDTNNKGVVSNLKRYLPVILQGKYNYEHKFTYDGSFISNYFYRKLSDCGSDKVIFQ